MNSLIKLIFRLIAGAVFLMSAPLALAADAPKSDKAVVVSESMHATATIVDVNKKERRLVLRDQTGNEVEVVAGPEVRNFDQIKKGDILEVDYRVAAASKLEKADKMNAASSTQDVARAKKGDKPGAAAMQTSTIVAEVVDIDQKNRLLTVQGPRGRRVVVKVPPDIKSFDTLKKGDKISALYSEAVMISVKAPAKK